MKSDEELDALVNQIALDNTIPLEEWPDVLEYMLKRLDHIAYNSFPLPKPPPLLAPRPPISISRESTVLVQPPEEQDSQGPPNANSNSLTEAATENHESTTTIEDPTIDVEATQPDATIQVPASQEATQSLPSTQSTTIPSTQILTDGVANHVNSTDGEKFMPPALLTSLTNLTNLLSTTFTNAPPHTIQRFAELLLKPTKHYRSLAKFLRACHRVVSVASGIDKFPLPVSHDGAHAPSNAIPIGSGLVNDNDEASGATLTPIPWASAREYVANQNGDAAGSPVSDEGVAGLIAGTGEEGISQGELLRKEQEAGVVPLSQAGGPLEGSGNTPGEATGVHVGGPPELDAADVGPQPEGTVFGEKPAEEKLGDAMDVDEKVEEKKEDA
ncbi:hypothetical protein TWF694_009579 [Orbilia ellipsospora]|uniref:Uncharacterized protein n=1 Tax=Orbilia ellipsospora TaxID=2528407 RepID=A0AAV9XB81_9PEZI